MLRAFYFFFSFHKISFRVDKMSSLRARGRRLLYPGSGFFFFVFFCNISYCTLFLVQTINSWSRCKICPHTLKYSCFTIFSFYHLKLIEKMILFRTTHSADAHNNRPWSGRMERKKKTFQGLQEQEKRKPNTAKH